MGKTDDAASNASAWSSSLAAWADLSFEVNLGGELILVVVVLGLIDNHCASKDRVGSVHGELTVSILVLGTSVETGLNLLAVTNTAFMDVIMRVTLDRSEWVEDVTGGVATVLKITELVDLHGVKTW